MQSANDEAGEQVEGRGAVANDLLDAMPFAREVGVELVSIGAAQVVAGLEWRPERCTAGGVLHGGAIMTLADSAAAACAFLNLPTGATTSTIESKTNFFRGVRRGTVRAVASPLHVGRTTIVIVTDVTDAEDRPVAHVVQTQAVLRPTT